MKYDWPLIRKAFVMGLLMTCAGIFLVMYTGWNEATILCLVVGPFLLLCCLVLALFYRWMAHVGTSRLPDGWDHLSPEAKHDVTIKRAREESNKGNRGARVSLWLMRLNSTQRRHVEAPIAERDD
ncbi:MAG TPA: hypothetical protein VF043_39590 [Ktedonobacteraceae bacterium]